MPSPPDGQAQRVQFVGGGAGGWLSVTQWHMDSGRRLGSVLCVTHGPNGSEPRFQRLRRWREVVVCIEMEETVFITLRLCLPKMPRFLWSIQIRMTNMKLLFGTPPPPTLTRPGALVCHSALITWGLGVGLGGGGGGGWVVACTAGGSPRAVCPSLASTAAGGGGGGGAGKY